MQYMLVGWILTVLSAQEGYIIRYPRRLHHMYSEITVVDV